MIKLTLRLKAGAKVCGDRNGICQFNTYRGGQAKCREYNCSLFGKMLEINEGDRYRRTFRLKECVRAVDAS